MALLQLLMSDLMKPSDTRQKERGKNQQNNDQIMNIKRLNRSSIQALTYVKQLIRYLLFLLHDDDTHILC
ncbi:CLUMA_CG018295, isoform A [Clunio marinus]|uniref:CLUMA_CG018295, isoform A n=1 Tax=Clunio marinus TaxID=568069 RepID=A0A1J1IYM7_9DIPT|nr:CLUMA_CG018295, isoform A [Clunio marinus]